MQQQTGVTSINNENICTCANKLYLTECKMKKKRKEVKQLK